jgi:tetratricopeptide (TPR) repeat protein
MKKMKKIVVFSIILLFFGQVYANEALQDSIKIANKAYKEKNYDAAIKTYNSILKLGYISPELHYNLANAYYKSDKIALSILNYEKALKLQPTFDDARYNLEMANKLIIDKIDIVPEFFLTAWAKAFVGMFHFDVWGFMSLILFALSFVLAGIYFFIKNINLRKIAFYLGFIFLLFSLITFLSARKQYQLQVQTKYAIIYETTVTVKSSPSENGTNIFPLHEGTKVQMLENVGEWTQIKIADGKQGWLKKEEILEI